MSILFISQSQRQAATLLKKAGMEPRHTAQTIQITRETAENWLHQEMEQGNLPLVFQMVKSDALEKDSQLLFDELKDMLVAKLIIRQQFSYQEAYATAGIILPFILKRMVELMQKNPKFKMWWDHVNIRKHLPTKEDIKSKIRTVGQTFTGTNSSDNGAFA